MKQPLRPSPNHLPAQVAHKVNRKLRARAAGQPGLWFGLGACVSGNDRLERGAAGPCCCLASGWIMPTQDAFLTLEPAAGRTGAGLYRRLAVGGSNASA
ncbi:MAG: hypothetical protein U1F42_05685 [Candidatus Competibacteraceae bacterium]